MQQSFAFQFLKPLLLHCWGDFARSFAREKSLIISIFLWLIFILAEAAQHTHNDEGMMNESMEILYGILFAVIKWKQIGFPHDPLTMHEFIFFRFVDEKFSFHIFFFHFGENYNRFS